MQIKTFCKENHSFHVKTECEPLSLVDLACICINFVLTFTCLLRAERPFESYLKTSISKPDETLDKTLLFLFHNLRFCHLC